MESGRYWFTTPSPGKYPRSEARGSIHLILSPSLHRVMTYARIKTQYIRPSSRRLAPCMKNPLTHWNGASAATQWGSHPMQGGPVKTTQLQIKLNLAQFLLQRNTTSSGQSNTWDRLLWNMNPIFCLFIIFATVLKFQRCKILSEYFEMFYFIVPKGKFFSTALYVSDNKQHTYSNDKLWQAPIYTHTSSTGSII